MASNESQPTRVWGQRQIQKLSLGGAKGTARPEGPKFEARERPKLVVDFSQPPSHQLGMGTQWGPLLSGIKFCQPSGGGDRPFALRLSHGFATGEAPSGVQGQRPLKLKALKHLYVERNTQSFAVNTPKTF